MPLTLKKPPVSEEEAATRSKPVLLPDGPRPAHIREARDAEAKKSGRPMIVLTVIVTDDAGNEREIPLYLTTSDAGLLTLRHACIAVGALAQFESGQIDSSLFPGKDVRVVIGTEKKRNWPARNVILDVLPVETAAEVVKLRSAS